MHVNNVFDAQVANIERKAVLAESLEQLDIVKGVSHAWGIPQSNGTPWQLIGTVEGHNGWNGYAICQITQIVDFGKLWHLLRLSRSKKSFKNRNSETFKKVLTSSPLVFISSSIRSFNDSQHLLVHNKSAESGSVGASEVETGDENRLTVLSTRSTETCSLMKSCIRASITAMCALWKRHK